MFKSYGYLHYDPESIRGRKTRSDPWWAILKCDRGLVLYYQSLILTQASKVVASDTLFGGLGETWEVFRRGIRLTESAWGAHVSVIRGEKPLKNKNLWGRYQNEKIEFTYDPRYLNTNGSHWWIRVQSERLMEIREELGLTPQPGFVDKYGNFKVVNPFHITIGRDVEAAPSTRHKK